MGYLLVATESIEGLIILGLVILFLIILYVIAELWKKKPEDDYEDVNDPDTRHVKTSKELKHGRKGTCKKNEGRRQRAYLWRERKEKTCQKKEKIKSVKIRTGGFVDEIYEDDVDEAIRNRNQP